MNSRVFALAVSCCSLALAACDSDSTVTAQYRESDTAQVLRRGNGGEPGTLDPLLAEDVHAFNILTDLYEGLVAEAADGSLIPGVAESWDISDDGRTYRFRLRADARWSNGDPLVASDFVKSFHRVASPETASPYGFLLEPILNFQDIQAGDARPSELGVMAESDQVLVVQLAAPTNHWLSILAMPITFPTHPPQDGGRVSNGAYQLKGRQIGGPIDLQKNTYYWDSGAVSVDEVSYLPVINPVAEYNMYRAGELDLTMTIPTEFFRDAKEQTPAEVRVAPSLAFYYMAFDLTEPPLDSQPLRRALSMAIDRKQLVTLIGRGEQAAFGIVPPGVADHVGAIYDWHDVARAVREQQAREFYADAGYSAVDPLSIKLTYDVGDIHERVALAVSSMWKEVLGVDVELEKKEWKYFLDTRDQRSEWQVMRFSWFGDYNDPMTFAEIFRSDSSQNLPRYDSPAYDRILDQAAGELDLDARIDLMTKAESTLINDYPIAPLYFYVSKHMVKTNVAGFEDNVLDRHPSKFLSIRASD